MLTCIGLDLAWSPRNATGAAVLRGDAHGATLHDSGIVQHDDEIIAYVVAHATTPTVLVAVDAPLCVPNTSGRRVAEHELAQVFAPYQAGAHPANRRLLTYNGAVRGETLVAALAAHGFHETAAIAAGQPGRTITEVYPHAAMIGIFDLPRTLKYKARPNRTLAERQAAWQHYQQLLASLQQATPALHGHTELVAQPVAALRGKHLKHYEDRVDALFCAYVALYAYHWGAARCRTFGTLADGHIFAPVPPALWAELPSPAQ